MGFNVEKTGQNLSQINISSGKTAKASGTNANDAILNLKSNSPDIELEVEKPISPDVEKTRLFFIFNKIGGFDRADLNSPVPLNTENVEKFFEQLGLEKPEIEIYKTGVIKEIFYKGQGRHKFFAVFNEDGTIKEKQISEARKHESGFGYYYRIIQDNKYTYDKETGEKTIQISKNHGKQTETKTYYKDGQLKFERETGPDYLSCRATAASPAVYCRFGEVKEKEYYPNGNIKVEFETNRTGGYRTEYREDGTISRKTEFTNRPNASLEPAYRIKVDEYYDSDGETILTRDTYSDQQYDHDFREARTWQEIRQKSIEKMTYRKRETLKQK